MSKEEILASKIIEMDTPHGTYAVVTVNAAEEAMEEYAKQEAELAFDAGSEWSSEYDGRVQWGEDANLTLNPDKETYINNRFK